MRVIAGPWVLLRCVVILAGVSVLGACSTLPAAPAAAPDYATLVDAAQARAQAGQVDQAVAALERAATLEPTRSEPWRKIARWRFDAGEYAQALVAADRALQLDPGDPQARDVRVASGLQIAIQTLRRLQPADPAHVDAQRSRATTLAQLLADVFGAQTLIPQELKARLAQQAIARWKQDNPATRQTPPEPASSPLDVLGGD